MVTLLEFQLTKDDYYKASRSGWRRERDWRRPQFFAGYCMIAVGFVLLVTQPAWNMWVAPALLIACGFFFLIHHVLVGYRHLERSSRENEQASQPTTLRLSEEGVHYTTPLTSAEIKWGLFSSLKESRDLFLLYSGSTLRLIIPKRAIHEGQVAEVRQLLQAHVGHIPGSFPVGGRGGCT